MLKCTFYAFILEFGASGLSCYISNWCASRHHAFWLSHVVCGGTPGCDGNRLWFRQSQLASSGYFLVGRLVRVSALVCQVWVSILMHFFVDVNFRGCVSGAMWEDLFWNLGVLWEPFWFLVDLGRFWEPFAGPCLGPFCTLAVIRGNLFYFGIFFVVMFFLYGVEYLHWLGQCGFRAVNIVWEWNFPYYEHIRFRISFQTFGTDLEHFWHALGTIGVECVAP